MKTIKPPLINHWKLLAGVFIFFVFFFLRLYRLGYHDFWYDEVATINSASKNPWSNWNAPIYGIFLHFWTKIFSITEFSLRFPSLLFSCLALIFIFLLGRELFNTQIASIAVFMAGLSPFHIWYAQEARDYSMALLAGSLSSYLFLLAIKKNLFRLWISFILVSVTGFYTNYFYIVLFFAQSLYILILKRSKLNRKEIIYLLIIILCFVPHLRKFLDKFFYVSNNFWIFKPKIQALSITLENFVLGYNGSKVLYAILDILMAIFLVSSFRIVHVDKFREPLLFCLFLLFFPVISIFFFSRLFFSIYLDRGLIIFSPYYYFLLALGIVSISKRLRLLLICLFALVIFMADFNYYQDRMFAPLEHHVGAYIKKPIRPMVNFLVNNVNPAEDIVAFTDVSIKPSINFYAKGKFPRLYRFFDPKFLDQPSQRPIMVTKYTIPYYAISSLRFKKLWVIFSNWARDGRIDKDFHSARVWLDSNFEKIILREFDGAIIICYKRT